MRSVPRCLDLRLYLAVCLVISVALAAFALAPAAQAEEGSGIAQDIGTLTDRYESLDSLSDMSGAGGKIAVDTRIGVLVTVNRALDKASVRFSGEALGELINADSGHKWVSFGDRSSSIAVYLTDDMAQQIENYGSYNMSGSVLEVTGEYHIACEEHQGELDVHATSVKLTDEGSEITHSFKLRRLVGSLVMCGFGVLLVFGFLSLRRRREKRVKQ